MSIIIILVAATKQQGKKMLVTVQYEFVRLSQYNV